MAECRRQRLEELLLGFAAQAGLVVLPRVSGKRTLTKMNAFDLVVAGALGPILATVLLSKSVALADGLTAFVLLIFMQAVLTWLSVCSRAVSRLLKSEPALLVYEGQFLAAALRAARITEEKVRAGLRAQGLASIAEAGAVVLETSGELSVLRHAGHGPRASVRAAWRSRSRRRAERIRGYPTVKKTLAANPGPGISRHTAQSPGSTALRPGAAAGRAAARRP